MEARQKGIAYFLIFVVLVMVVIVVFYSEGSKEMKGELGTPEEKAINFVKYYQGIHGNGQQLEVVLNGYKYQKFGEASTTGAEMASEQWLALSPTSTSPLWRVYHIFIINGNPITWQWNVDMANHTIYPTDNDTANILQDVEFLDEQGSK